MVINSWVFVSEPRAIYNRGLKTARVHKCIATHQILDIGSGMAHDVVWFVFINVRESNGVDFARFFTNDNGLLASLV